MPVRWDFRCYISPDGTEEIRSWYDKRSKKVQAKFHSRIKTLANLDLSEWNEVLYKPLHGNCRGLSEIRFKAGDVQHRLLGFRSGEKEYTILYCATEKGGKFVPLSACAKALTRKTEVLNPGNQTNAIWLALE